MDKIDPYGFILIIRHDHGIIHWTMDKETFYFWVKQIGQPGLNNSKTCPCYNIAEPMFVIIKS